MNQSIAYRFQRSRKRKWKGMQWLSTLAYSNRFTFGVGILIAVFLPEIVHPQFSTEETAWLTNGSLWPETGMFAAVAALLGAHMMLRRVGILPLVDDKMLILPTFIICYMLTGAVMTGAVHTYGRFHLGTSFVIGICWYFGIAMVRARLAPPRLAIVGGASPDADLPNTRIEWVPLNAPKIPTNVVGIVFDKTQELGPSWERLFSRAVLRNIPVYELGKLREMITGRVLLRSHPEEVFGELLPSQPYLRVKYVLDQLIALISLPVVLPLLAVLCILIKLDSPGPALFRQGRVGYQGRRFECLKLRTMRTDITGPAYTAENDPRITRLGRRLRKWRLDELPQVFNILQGEMSWIGPRPEAVSLARDYERSVAYYAYRHAVRPGITGWAAVHQGNVALADAAAVKLEYDFFYLKNFSIWLDFLVVLMTVKTVITGFGHK